MSLTDLVKTTWKTLIFIGIVSLTITWAFNIHNTLIQTITINGIEMKVFSIQTYMLNVSNAWETNALNFDTIKPPVQWININADIWESEFWQGLINNIAFIADWGYFPINFILWILRWFTWLIKILLALIGWNTSYYIINNEVHYYSNLAEILDWITQNLEIPYIRP